jgi:hypothetical protein
LPPGRAVEGIDGDFRNPRLRIGRDRQHEHTSRRQRNPAQQNRLCPIPVREIDRLACRRVDPPQCYRRGISVIARNVEHLRLCLAGLGLRRNSINETLSRLPPGRLAGFGIQRDDLHVGAGSRPEIEQPSAHAHGAAR